jgi:hypothetical protein
MAEIESVWNSGWAYFIKFFRGVKISVNCSSIFYLQRTFIENAIDSNNYLYKVLDKEDLCGT